MNGLACLLVATTLIAGAAPPGVRARPSPAPAPLGPTPSDVDAFVDAEVKRLRRQIRNLRREG